MKKRLALMLAGVATIATLFTGCGAKDISGSYVAEIKASEIMDQSELDEMAEYGMDVSDFAINYNFELTEDGKFTMKADTASFKEDFSKMLDENLDNIIDSVLGSMGVSKDDITDEVAQYSGYDSAEAMFDELKTEMKTEMESYYKELDAEAEEEAISGTYKVSKNEVTFLSDTDDGLGLDKGTLNEDGSITVVTEDEDGKELTLKLVPQK